MRSSLERKYGPASVGCSSELPTVPNGGDNIDVSFTREAKIRTGSKSIGARAWGHPETWEASSSSPNTRDGPPADQVLALRRVRDAVSEHTCRR